MKRFSKLIGFLVVFMVMMATMCTVSFAASNTYTTNLIPQMTSDTTPAGVASASENWYNTPAWKAFNRTPNHSGDLDYNSWATTKSSGWLAYEFSTSQIITKYTLCTKFSIQNSDNMPKNWTFEGWDGANWVILDTRNNIIDWVTDGTKKEFSFENSTAYKKYRINISTNVSGATSYTVNLVIGELEMMGSSVIAGTPTNLKATAGDSIVDLSWSPSSNAVYYKIKRTTTPSGDYSTIATTATVSYSDTTVKNGITYYYTISAVNAGTSSPNSNEVSAIPQASNQLKLVLEANEEKQLSITDELSDNSETTWASSDSTVATVDENGKVKALKPGNTVITCTSKDNSYTEKINVLVVDLDYQLAVDLSVGDTCRLTIDDLANTANVTWYSYNPTIATVSAKGKVKAISGGLTYIVVSDKDGNEIGRIYIRVRE